MLDKACLRFCTEIVCPHREDLDITTPHRELLDIAEVILHREDHQPHTGPRQGTSPPSQLALALAHQISGVTLRSEN